MQSLRNPWVLSLVGLGVVLLAAVILARPLGCVTTRMTVAEYARHDREGSMRAFVVTAPIKSQRRTGDESFRAGNTIVYMSGGLELTAPSGATMHELVLVGPDGEEATFYFDPATLSPPNVPYELEVRGAFESITVFQQYGPPADLSFGVLDSVRPVRPLP